jgi:hypothetical protein
MNSNSYSAIFDSITAFDIATYMPTDVLTLPFSTFEGSSGCRPFCNWALARLGRSAEDNGKLLHDHVKTK